MSIVRLVCAFFLQKKNLFVFLLSRNLANIDVWKISGQKKKTSKSENKRKSKIKGIKKLFLFFFCGGLLGIRWYWWLWWMGRGCVMLCVWGGR
jgi:hypothetical protein